MSYDISCTYIAKLYREHLSAGMSHLQACSHIHPPADASVTFRRSFDLVKKCLVKNKYLAQSWSEPHEGFQIVWPDIREASRHDSVIIAPNPANLERKQLIIPPKRIDTREEAKNQRKTKQARKNPNR